MRNLLGAVALIGVAACTSSQPPAAVGPEPVSNSVDNPAAPARTGEPPGFLFVDNFEYLQDDTGVQTYNGRPYAISLNTAIPGHDELRRSLAWQLHDAGVVEQVAFEPFGEGEPGYIEIHMGDRVPVAIAQAVLAVYGREQGKSLHVGAARQDEGFGNRERIYVGSLLLTVSDELTSEELAALLLPDHTAASFYGQLPEVPPQ